MNGSDIIRLLNSPDLKRLKALKKEAVWLSLLAVLSLVFYRFVYLHNVRTLAQTEASISATRSDIERLSAEISAAEGMRKTVAEAQKNLLTSTEILNRMKESLPSEKNLSRILAEISAEDSIGGVRIVSVKPLPVEDKDDLVKLPFQITLEARFHAFGAYLERIENLKRVMIVENFLIETKDDGKKALSAELFLGAYVLAR